VKLAVRLERQDQVAVFFIDIGARMHELDDAHLDDLLDPWFSEETQRLVNAAVQRMAKPAAARA
jgi:hypothetical protein